MAEPLVSDALWVLIALMLPTRPPRPKGGRPPLDDREALEGIVFVLRTGIPWASLPKAMSHGSGMTCWRRLRDWQAAGVFERLHRALLDRLGRANAIDFGRCSLDSASFPAKRMVRPVGKWLVSAGLSSLQKRIRPPSAGRGPRWRSARAGPHEGDGVERHFSR
jgi:transposase